MPAFDRKAGLLITELSPVQPAAPPPGIRRVMPVTAGLRGWSNRGKVKKLRNTLLGMPGSGVAAAAQGKRPVCMICSAWWGLSG